MIKDGRDVAGETATATQGRKRKKGNAEEKTEEGDRWREGG